MTEFTTEQLNDIIKGEYTRWCVNNGICHVWTNHLNINDPKREHYRFCEVKEDDNIWVEYRCGECLKRSEVIRVLSEKEHFYLKVNWDARNRTN